VVAALVSSFPASAVTPSSALPQPDVVRDASVCFLFSSSSKVEAAAAEAWRLVLGLGASIRRLRRHAPSPRSDQKGVGHPLPLFRSLRAGDSLAAPPQVALFPGGGAVAGAR
jgi:hypothetical protein